MTRTIAGPVVLGFRPARQEQATSTMVGGGAVLSLLGGFRLLNVDRQLDLCRGRCAQHLIALLAIRSTAVSRDLLAGLLWPDVSESCSHAALRSVLARIRRLAPSVVRGSGDRLWLSDAVSVDLRHGRHLARHLLCQGSDQDLDAAAACITVLSADLLPGWYDDWVVEAAEDWRQLRLHALEALANVLRERRRFGEAIQAAGAAIAGDPLRETARAALIRIHIAERNRSEALREFDRYGCLTVRKLGTKPSEHLRSLLSSA